MIVGRMLAGTASGADVATANANHRAWIRDTWGGRDALAMAACVDALSEAYGDEWHTLSERQGAAHLWLFNYLCPDRDDIYAVALEYRRVTASRGGPALLGDRIATQKGW